MLSIHFAGWFQCRLATDPDPTDEPRGLSGFTFAVAGEPDLDRVIRFQDPPPVTRRSHTPSVGVRVQAVELDNRAIDACSPLYQTLMGARVELIQDAKFDGQNYILAIAHQEPIDPFYLRISQFPNPTPDQVILQRQDLWDPSAPKLDIYGAAPDQLQRRQPIAPLQTSPEVADATGIMDANAYLSTRLQQLKADLQHLQQQPGSRDPYSQIAIHITALQKRIAALAQTDPGSNVLMYSTQMPYRVIYKFDINGPAIANAALLHGTASTTSDWPIEFWMGSWDSDALSGYVKGTLSIPFRGS